MHIDQKIWKNRFQCHIIQCIAVFFCIGDHQTFGILTRHNCKIILLTVHRNAFCVGCFRMFQNFFYITFADNFVPQIFRIQILLSLKHYIQIFIRYKDTAQSLFRNVFIQILLSVFINFTQICAQFLCFIQQPHQTFYPVICRIIIIILQFIFGN